METRRLPRRFACNYRDLRWKDAVVRFPSATDLPAEPEFSQQAREAKYQGTCLIALIVGPTAPPVQVRMISGLGMGLDEKRLKR